MELLERHDALTRLRHLLTQVEGGGGSLLMIGGEAGIGKSALIQQFRREIGRTTRMLFGSCDPLSTPRPLGPVHDIAEAAGGELKVALEARSDRTSLFTAVLNALSPTGKPVVAIIEDAHWADEATLDLLRFLGRRIERTRSLLLVTYRDDEVGPGHPLRFVLGDLATALNVGRMTLLPLSPGAVAHLAAGTDHDARVLHRLTGGNPFFVTEVLRPTSRGSCSPNSGFRIDELVGIAKRREVKRLPPFLGLIPIVQSSAPSLFDENCVCGVSHGTQAPKGYPALRPRTRLKPAATLSGRNLSLM